MGNLLSEQARFPQHNFKKKNNPTPFPTKKISPGHTPWRSHPSNSHDVGIRVALQFSYKIFSLKNFYLQNLQDKFVVFQMEILVINNRKPDPISGWVVFA
jgi:hypothetical protein